MKRGTSVCGAAALLSLIGAGPLLAQAFQGTVRVAVEDAHGGAVTGAAVTLRSEETGETREQASTRAGLAEFPNLLVGRYSVTVAAFGFKTYVRRNVMVKTNQVVEVQGRLSVGERAETVEVLAGAELVNATSSQLEGGTFNSTQIRDLPVYDPALSGDVTNFSVLAPGVASQPGGTVGQGGAIGGNRPRQNNFVLDGLDNNEPEITGSVAPVIQDAVAEFTLLTNQFNAEFGHSTAGQFITVTKSGTNEFHGGVWEYNINRKLLSLDNVTRAATPAGTEKPRYDNNRFGAQVGGPLRRDKLFFHAAYEYQTVNQAGSVASEILVPTANGLGTLKGLAGQSTSGVSPLMVGILSDHVPTAGTATTTVNVLDEGAGALVPVEVGPLSASAPNYTRTHQAMLNLDAHAGPHRVSARSSLYKYSSLAAGNLPTATFNSLVTQNLVRATVSDVWTVRPNVVNELRAGYTRLKKVYPVNLPGAPGKTDLFGNYIVDEIGLDIGPVSEYPQDSLISTLQFSDAATYVRGAHTFKVGAEYRIGTSHGGFLPRGRGEYDYASLDEFVHDMVPAGSNGALRGVGTAQFRGDRRAFYTFAQDSWRIHPRLTLDLGLRYERMGVPKDSASQADNALASITSIRTETNAAGQVIFETLSPQHQQLLLREVGESFVFRKPRADNNNFSPRVGFAWDVTGNGKTSVRGGFALAYDVLFGNLASIELPPQFQVEVNPDIACTLTPAPDWCGHASNVRYSAGGFLAGGGLLNVVDPTTRTDRAAARAQTSSYIVDDVSPETLTWSLSVQREIFKNYLVEVRYVGTRGRKLPIQRRLNAGIPIANPLPVYLDRNEALSRSYAGAPTLADAAAGMIGLLEPYGFYGTITQFVPEGKSWYDGISLIVERRFANGLGFSANYTYSRTEDYGENELFTSLLNPRRPWDTWDLASNRGLSGLHKPHKGVLYAQWELPKPSGGALRPVLANWLLTGTVLLESGQALTVRSGRDVNLDGDSAGDRAFENPLATGNGGSDVDAVCWNGQRASASPLGIGCGDAAVVGYVAIDPTARYVASGPGGMTGVGLVPAKRGSIIGPGPIHTLNLGLYKTVALGGTRRLRLGVQVVNATNSPSFALGSGSAIATNASVAAAQGTPGFTLPSSPQFLRKEIYSGGLGQSPFQRVVQLQAKLDF